VVPAENQRNAIAIANRRPRRFQRGQDLLEMAEPFPTLAVVSAGDVTLVSSFGKF
jgi:hypothetical protein